jgi:hypothetical protein
VAKQIRNTGPTLKTIRNTGSTLPRVEASVVQAALGAEATAEKLEDVFAPITLLAVRGELFRRLQSSGGRPALAGVTRRAKVPLNEQEWLQLEELAVALSSPGFAPSAGQVASVLLTLSLRSLMTQVSHPSSGTTGSPLLRELAAATDAAEGPPQPPNKVNGG